MMMMMKIGKVGVRRLKVIPIGIFWEKVVRGKTAQLGRSDIAIFVIALDIAAIVVIIDQVHVFQAAGAAKSDSAGTSSSSSRSVVVAAALRLLCVLLAAAARRRRRLMQILKGQAMLESSSHVVEQNVSVFIVFRRYLCLLFFCLLLLLQPQPQPLLQ